MEEKTNVYLAVLKGKFKDAVAETQALLDQGMEPQRIIDESLIPAMADVGANFEAGKAFVPEMLLAAKSMKMSLERIKPYLNPDQDACLGRVVIGTVKGDLHDIGKNLVASMMEGAGFEVINVGIDVAEEKFIQAIIEHKADILCLSALLTTTMTQMESVIKACEAAGIRNNIKIMVGGAPVTESFARQIGADRYTDNANAAAEVAKEMIKQKGIWKI